MLLPRTTLLTATFAFAIGLGPLILLGEEGVAFFESSIRPVLVEHCYECHSVREGKSKGGLRVDDRDALFRGGDSGPSVIAGKPNESLLLKAIRHDDPDLEMPPRKAKLPDRIASDFETWIANGAIDPREPESVGDGAGGQQSDFEDRRDLWSYRPVVAPEPPKVKDEDWPAATLDRFVLAKLEENGLSPSPDADPITLLRRLSFDLTGLPPSPEMATNFSMDRLAETVDALLASDGFGVRWGRHWLDVARFAESNGKEANVTYPHAWRFRDWVIDAFNDDLPYNRFLLEQLAGDLLPFDSEKQRARQLIATGFLAVGAKGLTETNDLQFAADVADEQIDAFSRAMLASSLACARCHDHKSDPVRMTDYYALAGIFKSTDTRFGTWVDSESSRGGKLIRLPMVSGQLIPNSSIPKKEVVELKLNLAKLAEEEAEGRAKAEELRSSGEDLQKYFNGMLREALRIIWTRGPIVGKLETVDDEGNALPLCMGVLDSGRSVNSPRYERGEIGHPAEEVIRAVPSLFGLETEGEVPDSASGRLQLAQWVADPGNPLTARVMVNRIWSHLFGAGLVITVDDFGHTGAGPSHPKLLDHLAVHFRESGWSVKSLVREMILSRTYRQSSDWRRKSFEIDPDNRLIWRMPKQRFDAEVIRDSMLAVSGELDPSPRPGSQVAEINGQSVAMIAFNQSVPDDLDGSPHRSVYLPVLRDRLPEVLKLFDFAEPSLVTGSRDTTNVPPQALYLMNSDFVRARAEGLYRRVRSDAESRDGRIDRAFELCFNRAPDETEITLANGFFDSGELSEDENWIAFCQALLASADFRIAD
ncbi:MAG: PSD1 domain-containing protein [Verrucomicrobiae bacterium]|nr:PSD1 domain-containing protein [Verrucomicrobiae bacterium]